MSEYMGKSVCRWASTASAYSRLHLLAETQAFLRESVDFIDTLGQIYRLMRLWQQLILARLGVYRTRES